MDRDREAMQAPNAFPALPGMEAAGAPGGVAPTAAAAAPKSAAPAKKEEPKKVFKFNPKAKPFVFNPKPKDPDGDGGAGVA